MRNFCLLVIVIVLSLTGCATGEKSIVKKENNIHPENFGPFFLPENHDLSSVSINYFTRLPETTQVYFSMVGEIDWIRKGDDAVNYHKMVFEGLEESAVYQFSLKHNDSGMQSVSSLKTMPYGEDFQFDFALATVEKPIDKKISPHFLVLFAQKTELNESEFKEFYDQNKEILASTVILPMFDFSIQGKKFSINEQGFYFLRYKNVSIIMINRDIDDVDGLVKFLSYKPEDKNFILFGNVSDRTVKAVSSSYGSVVQSFFLYPSKKLISNKMILLDSCQVVNVVKKAKYVMKY